MSNHFTAKAWLEEETARRYKVFTEKTSMYQELSRFMVDLADIRPGMRVLDLGCGTGISTRTVLEPLSDSGHVYGLDLSEPMLAVARQEIDNNRVTFLQADAVAFAEMIPEPVDRVICSSVFWQLRHKPPVMAEIRRVLAPDGLFVFNAPEPYFIFKDIPRSSKVSILFDQLAAERYGVGRQDLRTIRLFLENHGFDLISTKMLERTRPAAESYLFMQLPIATAWMEPPLDYETRRALLEEAWQAADPDQASKQRWMYFVARPRA
jgi:ubiquinone/menaquinone biosynthesis C-methylase UbiE